MSAYDVTSANTNRLVRFMVDAAAAGDADSAIFGILKGPHGFYPEYGALAGTPTPNQNLAQTRTNLVVRALSVYIPVVTVALANDSFNTGGLTANFGPALVIAFEADQLGVFFNNAWTGDVTVAKDLTTDITDTVGKGGMTTVKTKPGLNSLLAALATVSYDGGVTGPFGTLSTSGNIVLQDGTTTSGAPTLAAGVGTNASGLKVTFLGAF